MDKGLAAWAAWPRQRFKKLDALPKQYACRAGSETPWPFGKNESKLQEYAWFGEYWGKGHAYPVGQKLFNSRCL
ncbi:MAG: hypothetical protein G8345_14705 [Magnetococcales bacterium]|nr:hypothetical protein [Magnetococcales bacterium]